MATSFYQNPRDGLFSSIDINKDDRISIEEWNEAFDMIDTDKDGNISRKEWCLNQGETIVFDAIAMTTKERGPLITKKHWAKAFEVLDQDGNGFLNYAEWISMRNRMAISRRLIHSMSTDKVPRANPRGSPELRSNQRRDQDWNDNGSGGRKSQATAPKPKPPLETQGMFANIDQSKDGELSIDEWMQAFDIMDIDHDGHLSRKEWWLHQGDTDMFDAIGGKRNKASMTRKEWRTAFDLLDADCSGRIAYDEWLSFRMRKGGVNKMYHKTAGRDSLSGSAQQGAVGVLRTGPPQGFIERQQADMDKRQERHRQNLEPKLAQERAQQAHRESLMNPKRSSMQAGASKRSPVQDSSKRSSVQDSIPEPVPVKPDEAGVAEWDPEGDDNEEIQ